MNRTKRTHFSYFWNTILSLKCIYTIIITTTSHNSFTDATFPRADKERNIMLVLPVTQGSNDPSDPRLQFWYTKPPVTVVIENLVNKDSQSQSTTSPTTTQRYTEADIVTSADIITTNLPSYDYDLLETKSTSSSTMKPFPQVIQHLANLPSFDYDLSETKSTSSSTMKPFPQVIQQSAEQNSSRLPPFNKDIYVSFTKNKMKYSPTIPNTSSPHVQIIPAEPKWRSEIHKLIEYDKLKAKSKLPAEISTILPSSTRIQYYSDFVPLETNYRLSPQKSSQFITFEKSTRKPPTAEVRSPAAESDSQYDFAKVYDMMKKISLKPLPHSKHSEVEPISTSDLEYFNVLKGMAVPTESLFKDRTTENSSFKTSPSRSIDDLVLTYGPKEFTTLSTEIIQESVEEQFSFVPQQASTTFPPVISQVTPTSSDDQLTDDFKQMLVALGILQDNETTSTTTESNELWMDPESFTIDPLSYSKFKRIPSAEELPPIRKDMQSLLNSFGLLPKTNDNENFPLTRVTRQSKGRHSKSVLSNEIKQKSKLTNENVHKSYSKMKIESTNLKNKTNAENTTRVSNSVSAFPKISNIFSHQLKKLPKFTLFNLRSSLLPLITRNRSSLKLKGSKKKTMLNQSTTMKPKRANNNASVSYEDLANSFGGGETAKDEPGLEDLTTTPNGLYFLVDWNSFLRTGDDDDNKPIRVKFSPHVGDPKLFIPIDFP